MISSSQRFCGCSAECLESFDIFIVSWNRLEWHRRKCSSYGLEGALLQIGDVWNLHWGARREQREPKGNSSTGSACGTVTEAVSCPNCLTKASCPPGRVSEMWQLSDLGRQIPLTVTAPLRGQDPALTHMWAVWKVVSCIPGPPGWASA